jgi:hypothetical protein
VALRRYGSTRYYTVINDRLVVPIELALAQAVPELGREHAVAGLDSALHQQLITPSGLERAHDLARRTRGIAKTHEWWSLADARAESPAETRGRLSCIDAGVPPDALQQVFLWPNGGVAARVDLAWATPGPEGPGPEIRRILGQAGWRPGRPTPSGPVLL